MVRYYVFKKCYPGGTPKLLSKHGSSANAVEAAECNALGMIINMEGIEYLGGDTIFYTKSQSGNWRSVPLGYFVCKTNTIGKYIIYRKEYGYWRYTVKKIASIFITTHNIPRPVLINHAREYAYNEHRQQIADINEELLQKSVEPASKAED